MGLADIAIAILQPLSNPVLLIYSFAIAFATWFYMHRRSKIVRVTKLTKEEEDELIKDWQPEPLVPPVDPYHHSLRPRHVSSIFGKKITVDGNECLNLATHNYLGFVENEQCLDAAIKAVKKYGVGSCGPRGFFGTVDVHLDLESEIAKFMKTEEAILYSYGYSAISSAIPAYAKVGDVIFVDEACNFSIQQGLIASRSTIRYFKHNDVNDLIRLLEQQSQHDKKNPKKAKSYSKFLILEGLYMNTGDICPLPAFVELKHAHKLRLFIDDSCSFGVLGEGGRGIVEHYGLDISMDIDMIAVSLEYACAAYGGFCCGTHYIIDHQRLSGLGYCFSASLPPLQAAAGLRAIELIQTEPERFVKLRENCEYFHEVHLKNQEKSLVSVDSDPISPVKHLRFIPEVRALLIEPRDSSIIKQKALDDNSAFYSKIRTPREFLTYQLEKIVSLLERRGYALTVARYLEELEHCLPEPSIRLTLNSTLDKTEINEAYQEICSTFETVRDLFLNGDV